MKDELEQLAEEYADRWNVRLWKENMSDAEIEEYNERGSCDGCSQNHKALKNAVKYGFTASEAKAQEKIQSLEAENEALKKIKNIKLRADNIRLQQEIKASHDNFNELKKEFIKLNNDYQAKSQSVQKWIPICEPPKKDGRYLVGCKDYAPFFVWRNNGRWEEGVTASYTHWFDVPLLETPPAKEDEK